LFTGATRRIKSVKLFEVKRTLAQLSGISFKLPDGSYVPRHFHVTEVGLVTKHFIDCGGVERKETVANFQLWEAGDFDHRIAPQKFLNILDVSKKVLGSAADELEIEVEYQQSTIGKFGLEFDGSDFLLTPKQTSCLAMDSCGIPAEQMPQQVSGCNSPKGGCC
jgi:hypothetical protein